MNVHTEAGSSIEQVYTGGKITADGIYKDVPIERYHHDPDLFDGPAVSKSILKSIMPIHGGSPKQFWGRWKGNPNRIDPGEPDEALIFGRAAHCLLLGDEVFDENFSIRPDKLEDKPWQGNRTVCLKWLADQKAAGRMVLTLAQQAMIDRMHADAAEYPLIKHNQILNGRIERTLVARDPETGIILTVRPDAMPEYDGVFADLKTIASFDEDFMARQLFDAGYYLQGALIRMVCRLLKIPFETFVLVYLLKGEIPDTAHAEINDQSILLPGGEEYPSDLDLGEQMIRWALRTIRKCLDENHWPGREPFQGGERKIAMLPYQKAKAIRFLSGPDAALPPVPEPEQEEAA